MMKIFFPQELCSLVDCVNERIFSLFKSYIVSFVDLIAVRQVNWGYIRHKCTLHTKHALLDSKGYVASLKGIVS